MIGLNSKYIYNGTVLTMNETNEIIENGYVIVKEDKIEKIGIHSGDIPENMEVIDADGGIIMPGFINGHCHVSMNVFRSLGEDIPNRLLRFMIPMEDELLDREMVYIGAKAGIFEMLLSGVTTFADMYYFEDEVAKACEEIGIRCIAGETIINKPCPDSEEAYGGFDYFKGFYEKYKDSDLVYPALAPHSTYTVDEEMLVKIKELSEEKDIPILIHIAETLDEKSLFEEKGTTPVQYLNKIGFLSEKVIGAHLVYVNQEDIEILKESGIGIAHCIAGNSKSGRKPSPVPFMREKGVKAAFGTDGAMSGNHLDVMGLLGTYTKIHKAVNENINMCKAIEAVRIGTIEGAKAMGLDKITGSLEKGKKADIIIIETKSPNIAPVYDYYSALTYAAYPYNVTATIVNGKVVMKDRQIMVSDYNAVMEKFEEITQKIRKWSKDR